MPAISRSICRSCRLKLQYQEQSRFFATSIQRSTIPPEAPSYIDVPLSHQPDLVIPPRPKGILPVPREIFPANRPDKPSAAYIRNVTMDKLPKNVQPMEQMSALKKHKTRMTEARKQNLRAGLTELHQRKETMGRRIAQRSEAKQAERARLIAQPEREDARLTNVSTPQAMHLAGNAVQAESKAEAEAARQRKQANVARHAAQQVERRRDALHTLYTNARTFITTEAQLLAAIDREFAPDKWESSRLTAAGVGSGAKELNVWSEGEPQTVAEMLRGLDMKPRKESLVDVSVKVDNDQQRMKRIAEELSGGRM